MDRLIRVELIPPRLNPDLFQVGVAGEALEALCGERVPSLAERIDDGVVGVEQAMADTAAPIALEPVGQSVRRVLVNGSGHRRAGIRQKLPPTSQGSRMRTFKLSWSRVAKTGRGHQRAEDPTFPSYSAIFEDS
jgi:hypothetical protein